MRPLPQPGRAARDDDGQPAEVPALLRAIETGLWVPVIDSVRPLAAASAAHAHMEWGEHFGTLVLAI